jgi:hypothetical protein
MVSRRLMLTGGVSAVLLAGAGAWRHRERKLDAERALSSLERSRVSLARAELSDARRLAREALEHGDDPATLPGYVDAEAAWLVDGDGGVAEGVALVERARLGGLRGRPLATALLAAAVSTRNDRHALALYEQHERQGVEGDGIFELVAGAALDLACDPRADALYEASIERWPSAVLPRLRRARSAIVDGQLERAREVLRELPATHDGRRVLEAAAASLAAAPGELRQGFVPADAASLPRSLRPLAVALSLGGSSATLGIEAALDDADGPRALVLVARLAQAAGDLDSAERAVRAALRARPELPSAQLLAEQLADLAKRASP